VVLIEDIKIVRCGYDIKVTSTISDHIQLLSTINTRCSTGRLLWAKQTLDVQRGVWKRVIGFASDNGSGFGQYVLITKFTVGELPLFSHTTGYWRMIFPSIVLVAGRNATLFCAGKTNALSPARIVLSVISIVCACLSSVRCWSQDT
jgi:hypothetical protein